MILNIAHVHIYVYVCIVQTELANAGIHKLFSKNVHFALKNCPIMLFMHIRLSVPLIIHSDTMPPLFSPGNCTLVCMSDSIEINCFATL